MPTYDYKCMKCDHSFEEFQKMTDDLLTTCPVCEGNLKRLIGAGSGPIFKGTGFYHTDYKKKDYKNSKKSDESSVDKNITKEKTESKKEKSESKTEIKKPA